MILAVSALQGSTEFACEGEEKTAAEGAACACRCSGEEGSGRDGPGSIGKPPVLLGQALPSAGAAWGGS